MNEEQGMGSPVPVLSGLRVVEMTVWVAGPSAGGIMADWGADVVKVEPPVGDPQRNLFKAIGYREDMPNPAFAIDNRGKRSVVLDLRQEAGRAAMDCLLKDADVFLTNMRPAALERLGMHPDQVTERFPKIIYATVTGYGLDGPEAHRPGYDIGAFWARGGIARHLVPRDAAPVGVRAGLGDHVTGISTVSGILGALYERGRTGKGRVVETSLLRTGAYTIGGDIGIQLQFGRIESTKARDKNPLALVNCYEAGDGKWLWLIGLEADRHFPGVLRAIGREELAEDERFKDAKSRKNNCEVLVAEFDRTFKTQPRDYWADRFDEEQVWWAPAQSLSEVVEDKQLHAAGGFIEIPAGEVEETMTAVASPVTFRGDPLTHTGPVPAL
ncbi:MAG: CoA transferase, partial [Myxococcales bacterium]|nr:CoA transferase [Myxococcales bacterium]